MAADRTDIAHFFSSRDATGEVGSAAAGSKPLFHLRLVDRRIVHLQPAKQGNRHLLEMGCQRRPVRPCDAHRKAGHSAPITADRL